MPDSRRDVEQAGSDSVQASPSADQHCQTIAHVAALVTWAEQKLPEVLHIAMSDGVSPAEAAAAASITVVDLGHRWRQWAHQARHTGALNRAAFDQISALLADAERRHPER